MFSFEWTPREKWMAIITGVILTLFGIYIWTYTEEKPLGSGNVEIYQADGKQKGSPMKEESKENPEANEMIVIDVKGAVHRPGIYTFSENVRVYQVLQHAGGTLPEADTTRINLAQPVTDGSVLYIPRKGEAHTSNPFGIQSSTGGEGTKINVNTATAEELEKLNGLGPAKAQAIIQYREEHGKFHRIDDLAKVPGIGEKTIDKFRDQIVVQ